MGSHRIRHSQFKAASGAVIFIAAMLTVGACGTSNQSGAVSRTPDDQFIAKIRNYSNLDDIGRDDLISAGKRICKQLDAGATTADFTDSIIASGFPAEDAGHLVGSAVAVYCPQYSSMFKTN